MTDLELALYTDVRHEYMHMPQPACLDIVRRCLVVLGHPAMFRGVYGFIYVPHFGCVCVLVHAL